MIIYDVLKHKRGFLKYKVINSRAFVALLEVDRGFRGQGIGTKLLKQFESLENLKNVKNIYLRASEADTTTNYFQLIEFYKRNGYIAFSNDYKGIGLPMKKRLS
jgi:GNAT superfamily N-acetyltransferase